MVKKSKVDYEEIAYQQMLNDRKTIIEFYERFKDQIVTPQDLAVNGINMTKCLELMTKQTAQLMEFVKINNKKNDTNDTLTEEDADDIYDQIQAVDDVDRKH